MSAVLDLPAEANSRRLARLRDRRRRAIVHEAGPDHPEFGTAFMRYYLPHYAIEEGRWVAGATWHEELFREVFGSLGSGQWHDWLAPRGYAKSTIVGLGLPLAALGLSGLMLRGVLPYKIVPRNYVWIIQDSGPQAKQAMENLLAETEGNPRVLADFPHLRPALGKHNRPIADRDDDVVFELDLRLQALGAGMKLRGRRHRQHRPNLVLIDDLENDEAVLTRYQRDKLDKWLSSALSFAVAKGGDVHLIGTLLHSDAVLARVRKRTGWRHHRFDAFQSDLMPCPDHGWRVDPQQPLYPETDCDLCKGLGEVPMTAWEYRDHKWHAEMIARVGHTSYGREVLHIVTDEERKRFPSSRFKYDDRPPAEEGVMCRIAVDPNTKENQQGDPAAIVVCLRKRGTRRYHVDYAYGRAGLRGKALVDRVVEVYNDYRALGYTPIVVFENVQAQEWGKQELEDAGIPVKGTQTSNDKITRSEPSSLHYEMGRVTHAHELRGSEFESTLDSFPDGEHDDFVDALVYGINELEADPGGGVVGTVDHTKGAAQREDRSSKAPIGEAAGPNDPRYF